MAPHHRLPRLHLRIVALIVLVALPSAAHAQNPVGVMGIASEIGPIEKRLRETREVSVQGMVFRIGSLNGRQVVVARSGTGKVNAAIVATVLIGHFSPSALFFSGTAGAIDPALGLGDVVVGASVAHHDFGQQTADGLKRGGPRNPLTGELDPVLLDAPDTLLAGARRAIKHLSLPRLTVAGSDRVPAIVEGVIVTGDVFVANVAHREELRRSLNASAVEMEGAAFIQTCRHFGTSCLVVRSITDRADGQAMASYGTLREVASDNAAAVVAAIIDALGADLR
jgi:adenosylhomocysteine nucleosidase